MFRGLFSINPKCFGDYFIIHKCLGDEEDEREYDGKRRAGTTLNGYGSKKRRKQSKPIRLGSDSVGSEGGEEEMEEGEVRHGCPEDLRYGTSAEEEDEGSQEDAPLNLSSGKVEDEREVGSLRVLGRELLQNPDKEMGAQAYPQGGLNSHFGLPPHFLFPFSGMPGAPGSPSSESEQGFTPPTTQGGKTQIFNIEAYCKLCNKEFCNKYFLKTHMANKHGIYSDAGLGTSSSSGQRFDVPTCMSFGAASSSMFERSMRMPPVSVMNVSLPSTPVSISGSFMAMASMRQQDMRRDCTPSPHRGHALEGSARNGGFDKEPHQGSPPGSPRLPRSEEASPARMSPKAGPPPLISSDDRSPPEREHGEIHETKETDPDLHRKPEDLSNLGLRLSMVPHMNPFGPLPFFNMNPLNPMDLMRKEEERKEMMSSSSPRPTSSAPGGPNQSGGSAAKGSMTPDRLRQMGVINADAFCEFCCKEFCNKYFLRVHKLKKHGVCSPELPPEKVQKILAQMAKEAGKTGQPMPPLTLGTPSMVRPPTTLSDPPKSIGGPLGSPLNLIRTPTLPNFLSLPPLDPVSMGREDTQSSSSSDKPDEREEGRPINLQFSPRSMIEPECELKIDESASVIKSPLPEVPREQSQSSDAQEQRKTENSDSSGDRNKGKETSEGLANLQNMIMKLNNTKPKSQENSTVCKRCNRDMENKYFLHAHMMNEHGMLNAEEEEGYNNPPMSISLPQYPADLSKLTDMSGGLKSPGLNIPCPIISRPSSHSPLMNSLPKLSEKPMDYPKSIFEQMQGLPRPSFLDQMKKELGNKMDMSPMKRPSLDRDPNKKPASLSRSYCEICKKELCNKYFMKTHMMKMHGIVMDQAPPTNSINCEICKKEVSSKYFLKVHMANAHGLNEDGSPIPPHMRDNSLMNMFSMGEYPPPPMGEFSRLLMQQGEKNMERMKEMDRLKENTPMGHICSLCSNNFPDIVALQVHIIKSHGALPPGAGLESILGKNGEREEKDEEDIRQDQGDRNEDEDDITDRDEEAKEEDRMKEIPPFPFPLDFNKQAPGLMKNSPLNDMFQRQMMTGQFPGLMNPLLLPGLGAPGAGGQQFQGLFNMFLSEMLKKVQKDTPPQTPPISPATVDNSPAEEPTTRMEEATS